MPKVEYDHSRKIWKCAKSKKVAHKEEIDAIMSAYRTTCYSGRPVWHYKCPDCKKWHITGLNQADYYARYSQRQPSLAEAHP